jgi:hypothetical protein
VKTHSIHGIVTIAVDGAPPDVESKIWRLFGPSAGDTTSPPDIHISFTDRLPRTPGLRYVGLNEAAFDEERFYLLDAQGRRIQIDLTQVAGPLTIRCERGVTEVPLLIELVAHALLRKGHVLLHSASFVYQGKGVVATGWRKGGKTELLLSFMANGAHFVSDEWTIVSPHEGLVRGLATIAGIWDWQLRSLPVYWSRLDAADRYRLQVLRAYRRLYRSLPRRNRPSGGVRRILHELGQETGPSWLAQVRPQPEQLFEGRLWSGGAPLDRVLFGIMGDGDEITTRPIDTAEIAARMVASQAFERRTLGAAYDEFKFAFPNTRSAAIEDAAALERDLLVHALGGAVAYEVVHPYPVSLPQLYRVAAPLCE